MTPTKRRGGVALALILACLTLLPTGCGSILAFNMGNRPTIYGGTVLDAAGLASASPLVPLALIDLPMSLALDTALLPYAVALEIMSNME